MGFHIKIVWIGCIIPLCHHSILPFGPRRDHIVVVIVLIVVIDGVAFNPALYCTRFECRWWQCDGGDWLSHTIHRQRARFQEIYELLESSPSSPSAQEWHNLLCVLDTDEIHAIILLLGRSADRHRHKHSHTRRAKERLSCTFERIPFQTSIRARTTSAFQATDVATRMTKILN